jgi:hypothetical protein
MSSALSLSVLFLAAVTGRANALCVASTPEVADGGLENKDEADAEECEELAAKGKVIQLTGGDCDDAAGEEKSWGNPRDNDVAGEEGGWENPCDTDAGVGRETGN